MSGVGDWTNGAFFGEVVTIGVAEGAARLKRSRCETLALRTVTGWEPMTVITDVGVGADADAGASGCPMKPVSTRVPTGVGKSGDTSGPSLGDGAVMARGMRRGTGEKFTPSEICVGTAEATVVLEGLVVSFVLEGLVVSFVCSER